MIRPAVHMPLPAMTMAGPGVGLMQQVGGEAEIVRTIWCGDNLINQESERMLALIADLIREAKPDVVVAGPAFNAGRYGLACGMVARLCSQTLKVPVVIGLFPENPAVEIYRKDAYIWPCAETAVGMRKDLPGLARIAVKPTPTISLKQDSVHMPKMEIEELSPITRRDPTLVGRHYAVIEAMAAITIVDALMMARGYDHVCRSENRWREL